MKVIVFALSLVVLAGRAIDKERLKNQIREEIAKAQSCRTKSDCAGPLYRCPFGCNIYVNKSEVERIKELLASYPDDCEYKCVATKGFDCIDNKCRTIEQ